MVSLYSAPSASDCPTEREREGREREGGEGGREREGGGGRERGYIAM